LSVGRSSAGIAVAIAIVVTIAGCKRQKPPAMTRVWLGPYHGCATLKAGELECWGANDVGQLGDGTKIQRTLPVLATATGVAAESPDDLAIGARHTCGLFSGHVSCWGDGARGQLASLPVGVRVTAISAAGDRTCALTKEGSVTCWGDGHAEPAAPEGITGVASLIAVGPGRVCAAITEPSRVVRCSGTDAKPMLAGATIKGLAAGGKHTCALLEDGSVQCWGANDLGQLGDGTTADTSAPALVHALPAAVEIRAGANHTCARLRNNTVACWGDNRAHQLANGTTVPSSRPLPLTGLVGVFELALAGDSSCARLAEGGARCWGGNSAGQLGDGTTTEHDVPMPIRSPMNRK
jgi:alpha-tubulin suppressor-like RCC1 family protein